MFDSEEMERPTKLMCCPLCDGIGMTGRPDAYPDDPPDRFQCRTCKGSGTVPASEIDNTDEHTSDTVPFDHIWNVLNDLFQEEYIEEQIAAATILCFISSLPKYSNSGNVVDINYCVDALHTGIVEAIQRDYSSRPSRDAHDEGIRKHYCQYRASKREITKYLLRAMAYNMHNDIPKYDPDYMDKGIILDSLVLVNKVQKVLNVDKPIESTYISSSNLKANHWNLIRAYSVTNKCSQKQAVQRWIKECELYGIREAKRSKLDVTRS